MIKIEKITIVHAPDYDADLSYLGEFSNERGPLAIHHNGGRNSYEWFNPANAETLKHAQQDYKRMMDFENGNLSCISIRAVATVATSNDDDGKTWLINKIESGGLYGIESDSDDTEIKSIEAEQLDELKDALHNFGIIDETINHVQVETKRL